MTVGVPSYRSLLRPAFLTAGAALLAFGLAHAAFITWEADRSADPSLLARFGLMFAAPVGIGVPFAVAAALLGALAWRATRPGGRLASWRYGAVLATGLLPGILVALATGPWGDEVPPLPILVPTLAGIVLVPAALGAWRARSWRGVLVGLAAAPFGATWTMFLLGEGLTGWVVPFVVSLVAILVTSGWLMERLTAR